MIRENLLLSGASSGCTIFFNTQEEKIKRSNNTATF